MRCLWAFCDWGNNMNKFCQFAATGAILVGGVAQLAGCVSGWPLKPGELAASSDDGASTASSPSTSTSALSVSERITCVVVEGNVQCWGLNISGGVGNGASHTDTPSPAEVLGITGGATAVATGGVHTCAIVTGGVHCWGWNYRGQLGNNQVNAESAVPVNVFGLEGGVTAIATGREHSCALVEGGARCWGLNHLGQLGTDDTVDSPIPVQVSGLESGVTAIASSSDHTCVLVNGEAMCWGNNSAGQLGNDDYNAIVKWPSTNEIYSRIPVPVKGLQGEITAIGAGSLHTCAIVDSAVQCWGDNSRGQLGNNDLSVTVSSAPLPVVGLETGVTALAVGDLNACAIVDGAVKCWGDNSNGQLGSNADGQPASPIPVPVVGLESGVTAVGISVRHACAVVGSEVRCWGDNDAGQLGNGGRTASKVPVRANLQ